MYDSTSALALKLKGHGLSEAIDLISNQTPNLVCYLIQGHNPVSSQSFIVPTAVYGSRDRATAAALEMASSVGDLTMTTTPKPPLGLQPRHLHEEQRCLDIIDAMIRCIQSHYLAPNEKR